MTAWLIKLPPANVGKGFASPAGLPLESTPVGRESMFCTLNGGDRFVCKIFWLESRW